MIGGYRHMCVSGCRQAQRPLQKNLSRCALQKVGTADDIGNALRSVVHDNGKLVGKQVVATPDHEITDVAADSNGDCPLNTIAERDRIRWSTKAYSQFPLRPPYAGAAPTGIAKLIPIVGWPCSSLDFCTAA